MQTRQRIYSLDVLKILGTVLIVFHHYQQYLEVRYASGVNYFFGQFFFGNIVELFFLLSGLFAWHYVAKIQDGLSFERFFGKTWLRFAPFLILGALGSGALHVIYQKLFYEPFLNTSVSVWNILKAALGIHSGWMFAPQEPINGHTWYVSVLLLCYGILWLLVRLSQRRKLPLQPLLAGMAILGIVLWELESTAPFLAGSDARGYMSFFFGLLLADFLEKHPITPKAVLCSLGIVLVLTWLIVAKFTYVQDGLHYLLLYIYYPCLVVLFLSAPARKLFCRPWLGTLSAISFDTYMWHGSILLALRILSNLRPQIPIQSRLTMYAVTAVCFLCGTVSHFILEKPYNHYLASRAASQPQKTR